QATREKQTFPPLFPPQRIPGCLSQVGVRRCRRERLPVAAIAALCRRYTAIAQAEKRRLHSGGEQGVGWFGDGPEETLFSPSLPAKQHTAEPTSLLRARLCCSVALSSAMSSKYPVGPTETERCIESLLAVFQRYAGKDGDACSLSKREFITFMNTELASFTKNQKDPAVVDRMMKKLDMNNDGKIDFGEFLNLIGGLAEACHRHVSSAPKP
uniref:Protein S100-A11 n=1 Tax=Salvator merianae TaxID=96440 RepID=A0A8D0E7Y6_SALMN